MLSNSALTVLDGANTFSALKTTRSGTKVSLDIGDPTLTGSVRIFSVDPLLFNSNVVWHAGNFNPSTKADSTHSHSQYATLAGGNSFTGAQSFSGGNFSIGSSQFFVNSSNGRVGIGTNSPSQTLHVEGTVQASHFTASTLSAGGISHDSSDMIFGQGRYGAIHHYQNDSQILVSGGSDHSVGANIVLNGGTRAGREARGEIRANDITLAYWAGGGFYLNYEGISANHAVRADRSISSGDGLSGGGNLTANRTLAVDNTVVRTTNVNQSILGTKYFDGTLRVSGIFNPTRNTPADANFPWGGTTVQGITSFWAIPSTPNSADTWSTILHVGVHDARAFQIADQTNSASRYYIRSKNDQTNAWKPWVLLLHDQQSMDLRISGVHPHIRLTSSTIPFGGTTEVTTNTTDGSSVFRRQQDSSNWDLKITNAGTLTFRGNDVMYSGSNQTMSGTKTFTGTLILPVK